MPGRRAKEGPPRRAFRLSDRPISGNSAIRARIFRIPVMKCCKVPVVTTAEAKKARRAAETPDERAERLANYRAYKRAWYAAKIASEVQRRRNERLAVLPGCPDCGARYMTPSGRRGTGRCPNCRQLQAEQRRLAAIARPRLCKCGAELPEGRKSGRCAACRRRRQKDYHLRYDFKMTMAEYDALLEAQGGGCALCGQLPGRRHLAVDHDHATGANRGILCHPCNMALGWLEGWAKNTGWIGRAEAYLQKYSAG